jgi:hypothetical protein
MEGISACLMAHVNTAGVHVPLWMDSNDPSIGWGVDRTNFPMQEGTFFGDILDTGALTNLAKPNVTAPVAYYCDGAGFPGGASGVVAGRLGANQAGAPYVNPYGNSTLCQNAPNAVGQFSQGKTGSCPAGSNSNPAAGCPDGYTSLSTGFNQGVWQHGITVWRNNNYTPVFDSGYSYKILPVFANGSISIDVKGGGTSNGTSVQQYTVTGGIPQQFQLIANGSYWHIAMATNTAKCVDLSGGATSNGTLTVINDCNNSSGTQNWKVTPDASTGAFVFNNAQAGRCLDEPNWNTASGLQLDIWDCNFNTNQKFNIQAYSLN